MQKLINKIFIVVAMTIFSTGCVFGCSPSDAVEYTLFVQCIDSNGHPIANTEIKTSGITASDLLYGYTTDSEGKFTITNATSSKIEFMIVTEEVTTKQAKEISDNMKHNGEVLIIVFDI